MLGYWDLVTVICLLFVAVVTPFEIGFLDAPEDGKDIIDRFSSVGWLFCINRLVDLIFLADLVLQFRLMYTERASSEGTLRWVRDPLFIARHYLRGWFTIDALSIMVSAFDIIPLVQDAGEGVSDAVRSDLRSLRMARVMRVLRLIKLARLLRASRLFQRWETKVAINYSSLSLVKSIVYVLLLSHWFACLWGLQVVLAETTAGSWMQQFGYCTAESNVHNETGLVGAPGDECVPSEPWALYSVSAYWAVMTITSIGYGDIHAADHNIAEQVVNTILMLLGGIMWGHVIGTFCGVVATMSPHVTEFNRRMDDLNHYAHTHNLDHDLRRRLREYLHQSRHLQATASSQELLSLLSPALQGEVAWVVNKRWLERICFFKHAEPEFLVQVSLSLKPLIFTPGELAVAGYLYVIHRGIALYGGRVLTSGKIWGEDFILRSQHLRRRWCARAMNYLEVYMISRDVVFEVAAAFPFTYTTIHKAAVRMALRRKFILAAKLVLQNSSRKTTLDRIFEQATTASLSELKLQGSLTAQRLYGGSPPPLSQQQLSASVEEEMRTIGELFESRWTDGSFDGAESKMRSSAVPFPVVDVGTLRNEIGQLSQTLATKVDELSRQLDELQLGTDRYGHAKAGLSQTTSKAPRYARPVSVPSCTDASVHASVPLTDTVVVGTKYALHDAHPLAA
jgi:hypothetical protein